MAESAETKDWHYEKGGKITGMKGVTCSTSEPTLAFSRVRPV
jgi:hypothetical protein